MVRYARRLRSLGRSTLAYADNPWPDSLLMLFLCSDYAPMSINALANLPRSLLDGFSLLKVHFGNSIVVEALKHLINECRSPVDHRGPRLDRRELLRLILVLSVSVVRHLSSQAPQLRLQKLQTMAQARFNKIYLGLMLACHCLDPRDIAFVGQPLSDHHLARLTRGRRQSVARQLSTSGTKPGADGSRLPRLATWCWNAMGMSWDVRQNLRLVCDSRSSVSHCARADGASAIGLPRVVRRQCSIDCIRPLKVSRAVWWSACTNRARLTSLLLIETCNRSLM